MRSPKRTLRFCRELLRTLASLPQVESTRRSRGLGDSLAYSRGLGRTRERRTQPDRLLLRRAISAVDRMFPGGGNCYRRVLLEIALDGGAAVQPVMLGLQNGGGPRTGHAWLQGTEADAPSYDAIFSV